MLAGVHQHLGEAGAPVAPLSFQRSAALITAAAFMKLGLVPTTCSSLMTLSCFEVEAVIWI